MLTKHKILPFKNVDIVFGNSGSHPVPKPYLLTTLRFCVTNFGLLPIHLFFELPRCRHLNLCLVSTAVLKPMFIK